MDELDKAAEEELLHSYAVVNDGEFFYERNAMLNMFRKGAQWQSRQSPWITVADEEPPEYADIFLSAGSRPNIFVGHFDGNDFKCKATGQTVEFFRVLHWMHIPK